MPHGSIYGNLLLPSGYQHIQRFGPSNSALAQFMYPFAWRDVVFIFDDFAGGGNMEPGAADWDEALWVGAGTNGTDFIAATNTASGAIRATTGSTNGEEQTLRGDVIWLGDQNCGMEVRWKIDDIDGQQSETGFVDPLSGYAASAVNNIDTPTITNGAADVALVARDTGATLKTQALITDGSTSNMNTTKTDLGTRTPTNAVYQVVRVQLAQTASAVAASHAFILDNVGTLQEDAQHGEVLASQIKGDVLMQPWFYLEPLASAALVIDIDYWGVWMDRS